MARNELKIIYDILLLCRLPKLKTHIMHGSYLPYNLTIKYINSLLRNGLLEKNCDEYEITYRGLLYLGAFQTIQSLLSQKGLLQYTGGDNYE